MATSRFSEPDDPLAIVSHRPYALPKSPWRMMQRWNDLLFAHWPVPVAQLESLLPTGLQIDTFDQSGWVGVVPFSMDRVELRGIPRIPGASRFPELNLRTYVRERNTNRAGVYFFCLEASNPLAVIFAKTMFHLPYHWARMSIKTQDDREFTYRSDRLLSSKPVGFRAKYRGSGKPSAADQSRPGTIEHFLTERYCLFTANRSGRLLRGDIHHLPWPLETAEAEIERNDLPATYGIELPDTPPLLHYSRELVVYLWSLDPVSWGKLPALEAAGVRTAKIV